VDYKYLLEQIFHISRKELDLDMNTKEYIHPPGIQSKTKIQGSQTPCNTALDWKCYGIQIKVFVIYHSENPRLFKNVNNHILLIDFCHDQTDIE
jgi:hypothetical protein